MMAKRKGLLLVMMEPPSGLEGEFNDWYDTEHFPQRRALPGFESASRWVCIAGWPRWAALYDLAGTDALATPEYLMVSGANSTPWSRRILPRTIGRMRIVAEQLWPGESLTFAPEQVSRLLIARYRAMPMDWATDPVEQIDKVAHQIPGLLQVRAFGSTGQAETDLWVVAEYGRPVLPDPLTSAFAAVHGTGASLLNLYVPYLRA